jgi:ATP phosphoribosyltransferase
LYIREKTNDKNDLLMPELKNEMDRLKKLKIYDEVVSKSKIMLGEESRPDENKKLKDITEKLKEILKLKAYNKIVNEINSMLLEESKSERYQPTKVRVYHPIKEEIAAFIKEATYKVIFTLTIPARRA